MLRLSVIGFLFHAPGLKLFAHATFTPLVLVLNAVVLALMFAAMGLAWRYGFSIVLAWLIGHFAWSCCLVAFVRAGQVR